MEFRKMVLKAAATGYGRMAEAKNRGEGRINRHDKFTKQVRHWKRLVGSQGIQRPKMRPDAPKENRGSSRR